MEITDLLQQNHLLGVVIGAATFLIIGAFHPLVIKGYYYFGKVCRWWFLLLGIICLACSLIVANVLWSTLLGVIGFSALWSIKEIGEQEIRVKKGWFPANPKHRK